MTKIQNCWDFMNCSHGPDTRKVKKRTTCPAAKETELDGVHGGKFGGRVCWFVNDTSDSGTGARGDFSNKYPVCMTCRFYRQVRDEEGQNFEISLILNTYLSQK